MYQQQHSFDVFQHYFKKDTKAWFSRVRLIYSLSLLLHDIISNRTNVNAHFFITLEIISQISIWLSVRISLSLSFNRMRLFYFKEKSTTPLRHGGKTMKKHMSVKKLIYKDILA